MKLTKESAIQLILTGIIMILTVTSLRAQAQWGWGMKHDWSVGFYVESGEVNKIGDTSENPFAIGLDVGTYLGEGDNIFVGLDFGFGNTRLRGKVTKLGEKSLIGNQHIRGLVGFKFNQWLQIRAGAGLGGKQEYRGALDLGPGVGVIGYAGWSTKSNLAWKASALIGPVELGYSHNGVSIGIKFIR